MESDGSKQTKISGKKTKAQRKSKETKSKKENNGDAELETKIRRRVALEEKSFRIVERLVEESVTEETLSDMAQFIDPSHYADITEERFLADMCGYPICSKAVGKVLSQKYYISTKSNRVYDITDRKKFCSNQCFKSSKHFSMQISSSPVWLREDEKPIKFTFISLDDSNKGSMGDDIILTPANELANDIAELNKIDSRDERSKMRLQKVMKENKSSKQEENATHEIGDKLSSIHINTENKVNKASTKSTDDTTNSIPSNSVPHVSEETAGVEKTENKEQQFNPSDASVCPFPQKLDTVSPNIDHLAQRESSTESSDKLDSDDDTFSSMYHSDYSFSHQKRRELYGMDHIQQINKSELCKEIVQQDIPAQGTNRAPRESVYKRTKNYAKSANDNAEYGFDYQARESVYGLDHQQQLLKMQANKELLLKELQQTTQMCNDGCESKLNFQVNEMAMAYGTKAADLDSVQLKKVQEKVNAKGNALLELLDKRDALKRMELNEKQNVAFESNQENQEENESKSGRYSGILQNVERAAQQQHVFHSDQSKQNSVSDSDDDDDDDADDDKDADDVTAKCVDNNESSESKQPEHLDNKSIQNESESTEIQTSRIEKSSAKKTEPTAKQPEPIAKLTPFMLVNQILFDWKTKDSLKCLKPDKEKRNLSDFEQKYNAFGRRLDKALKQSSDIIGDLDSDDDWDTPSGALPDMSTLKQQGDQYTVKVHEYLGSPDIANSDQGHQKVESGHDVEGHTSAKSEEVVEEEMVDEPQEDPERRRFMKKNFPMQEGTEGAFNRNEFVTEPQIVLPYVDSSAQINIRRKIVLDKLRKALPDLLQPLRLILSDIGRSLRELVNTFNLTSSNVTLKPAEWTLMGLLILKILGTQDEQISTGFELISARTYFDRLTETIGISGGQVDHIVRKFVS